MRKITLLLALVAAISWQGMAQVGSYSFSATSGTFDTLVAATQVSAIEADYATSGSLPIGFTFNFDGVDYTTLKAASDGFVTFNASGTTNTTNDLDNVSATRRPLAAPLWDDHDGRAIGGSTASYLTSGTAPNRVFTFEWKNWEWNYGSSNPVITFQVKLYETTNIVEFHYKQESGTVNSGSASIGMTGVSSFISLDGSGAAPSASTTSETTNISTKPATGQVYSFTPPTCPAPTALAASNVTATTADLAWTESGSATSWELEYGITGFVQGAGTSVVTATNPHSLTGLSSSTTYEFYVRSGCGATDSSNWVGPITFSTPANCPAPSSLGVTNVLAVSADLGWTENGSATAWEIEWDTAGFTQGSGTMVAASGNPHSLTGLTANTSYEFFVRAGCGAADSSTWVGPFSFNTACSSFNAPFTESFDGSTLPSCWSQSATTGGPWKFGNPGFTWNTSGCSAPSEHTGNGGSMAAMDFSTPDAGVVLELPIVDVTTLTSPYLTFWYFMCNSGYSPVNKIYVEAWNGSAWALVDSNVTGTSGWEKQSFDVSSNTFGSNLLLVRFRAESGGSSNTYYGDAAIDDVEIKEAPNCLDPSAGVITNIATTSADLGWTENGTATNWQIEWDTTGFTQGNGTKVVATTNPHSLTGLTANTSYEFYVRAACNATDSSAWVGPYSFSTLCSSFAVPFNEGFNSTSTSLGCWSVVDNNSDGDTWSINTSSFYSQEGDQSAQVYTDYNSGANDDYLITPQITLTANNRMKYWVRARSSSEPHDYKILVSTSSSALASFTDTIYTDTVSSTTYAEKILDLSAYTGNVFIAFYIPTGGLDGYYMYVDNFTVEVTPSCLAPSALTATTITATTADLGWTENGTATTWDIEMGAAGFTPTGTGTIVGSTTNPHSLTGLTANTAYDYYVKSDCGGASSTWTGPYSFSTICSVYTPYYSETFDSFVPSCWDQADAGSLTTGPTSVGTSAWRGISQIGNTVAINLYSDSKSDWVLSPYFDLTTGGYEVSIDVAVTGWNSATADAMGSDDSVRLVYSENGTTWNLLKAWTAADALSNSLTTVVVSVPSTAANVQFGILATEGAVDDSEDYDFHFDNFIVRTPPTCPKPTVLTVGNITNNSASLGWTENGSATAWEIEYDTVGFTMGTGNIVAASSNPHTLNSLSANTAFEYYVRSVCGVGDSSIWVGPLGFTTTPDTINSFPYSNDIEAGLGLYLGLRDSAQSDAFVSADAANTGSLGIYLTGNTGTGWTGGSSTTSEAQAYGSNSSHISAVDMIVDATTLTSLTMKFDLKQTYSYGSAYSWGRILVNGVQLGSSVNPTTDLSDPFTTVSVDLSAYAGTSFVVSLEHSGKYNNASGSSGKGDNAYIDNIELYQGVLASAVVDSNVTCVGAATGGATASAVNGTTPYTYLWSNSATTASITGVMAGVYNVTVTDAVGDSSFASVTITDGTPLALNLGNDTSVCLNASLTLDAGTFTSYLWDDASTMQTRATVNTAIGSTNYSVTVTNSNGCTAVDTIAVTVMGAPVPNLGNDTSICSDATLTLDAGTFTSYLWDDASTMQTRTVSSVLGASTYYVEVTNVAGCMGSDTIVVTGYSPVVVDLGNDTSVCDAVSLTLDAGTFTSYLWDDASTMQTRATVSTLGAVNYSVVVTDANGCTANDTIAVTGYAVPMVNLGNDTTVCDAVTLTLDAGTFASYVWDDASTMQTRMTVSTLGAVNYSVEVTDANGCLANDTIEVTGVAPVMVDLGSDTVVCYDETYTLDAGAGFATYFWSNGTNMQTLDVTSTGSGTFTYVVTVTDANGCTGTDDAVISTKDPVMVDLGADTMLASTVTSWTLDAGPGFVSYVWSEGSTTQSIDVVKPGGTFYVNVTDVDGCMGSDTVEVQWINGIGDLSVSSLKMYPNPAVNQVTVEFDNFNKANEVNISFTSITGQVVMTKAVQVNGTSLKETYDVSNLATGTYLVQFEANGEVVVRQFIIK